MAETAFPGSVRFVPVGPGASVRIDARLPQKAGECPANQPRNLHAAYPGTLEVGRRSNGLLYLVTELSFPDYLKGIDEVPRTWPLEALKAQVVSARTYALGHLAPATPEARELNYSLCATDACQVYRGLKVERGPWGAAWSQAVAETAEEILEWEAKPATTFYFSTSNGRTYSNATIFGGAPLPYLKPVDEADDGASPVSRWSFRMPISDVAESLRLAGAWEGPISSIAIQGEMVRISGAARTASLSIVEFRRHLNRQAVCLEPKRYPALGPAGRPLPQVLPSRWVQARQEGAEVVFEGRGWGHGVGMVQWGVKGKADRGMDHASILAFYYGGLRPVRRAEPGTIRIGLAVDVEEVTVERSGKVRMEGAKAPSGPMVIRGGPALIVGSGSPIPPVLKIERTTASERATRANPAAFSFELSSAANVSIAYRGPGGVSGETVPEPRDRGPQSLAWDAGAMLASGTYTATVTADDGVDRVSSPPFEVTVEGRGTAASPESPSPVAGPPSAEPPGPGLAFGLAALGVAGLLGLGFTLLLRRRRLASRSL